MNEKNVKSMIKAVEKLDVKKMHNKDFLLTWEQPFDHIQAVVWVAQALEELYRQNVSCRAFEGGLAVSNFRDKSTRTRFSFASAASLLGLSAQDMDESKSQVAHGETVRETANMISFLTEVIGIRDDLFPGESHAYMAEVAEAVEAGFKAGVLPQRPAVLNLQCDLDHPTQSLADLIHLVKVFGGMEELKGKKIAMTWAYSPAYGKPMSVAQGIVALMTRFGMEVTLAHPEGYDLLPSILEVSAKNARKSGGSFRKAAGMEEAFKDADAVYPKSWAPLAVMEKRTALLRQGKAGEGALGVLEKECIANNDKYKSWECTEKLMATTRGGAGLYMHCLPADITDLNCQAGEVANSVFDRYKYDTYHEAEHKLYVMAAMILLTRFSDVPDLLGRLLKRGTPRRFE